MNPLEFGLFYDRAGRPITQAEWGKLITQPAYKRVASTLLPNGAWVSTVWMGLNHNSGFAEEPLIFETMVFDHRPETTRNRGDNLDCYRYATEAEAHRGHLVCVDRWAHWNGTDEPPPLPRKTRTITIDES